MPSPLSSILRASTRTSGEPLNILTCATHEAYQSCMARTGHHFCSWGGDQIKDWNTTFRSPPANYHILNKSRGAAQLPPDVDFDLILCQNRWGQFPALAQLSATLHLPLVCLEHCLPPPGATTDYLAQMKAMRGHLNVFISEMSRAAWGWEANEAIVIHHGIEVDVFSPNPTVATKNHALSVVNDWINRDWACGFNVWRQVSQNIPTFVVGDTPGLSKPAASLAELIERYREAAAFLNTSLVSPVPTSLLEAMSCGIPVVSTATCMIPSIIQNGVNGFISNDPSEMNYYLRVLLDNPDYARKIGAAGRQTILEKFHVRRFVDDWNMVFQEAASIVFRG